MSKETNRRDFIGYSFAAVVAVGGAASLCWYEASVGSTSKRLAGGFRKLTYLR